MTPVVELRAARKRFGRVEALKGVDLAIGTGAGYTALFLTLAVRAYRREKRAKFA